MGQSHLKARGHGRANACPPDPVEFSGWTGPGTVAFPSLSVADIPGMGQRENGRKEGVQNPEPAGRFQAGLGPLRPQMPLGRMRIFQLQAQLKFPRGHV